MRIFWILAAVAVGAGLYLGVGYLVERSEQATACGEGYGAQQVAACTALIESPRNLDNEEIASAYMNRGNGYTDISDYENALADYQESVLRDPEDFAVFHNRAIAYMYMEEYELALKDHGTAIDLYSEHPTVFLARADTFYFDGQYEESIFDLKRAMELGTDDTYTLNSLAWTLLIVGRAEEALPYSKRSLEGAGAESSGNLDTYAHVMSALGRQEEAADFFLKAARLGDAQYIRRLQEALASKGLFDTAPDGLLTARTTAAIEACVARKCRLQLPDVPTGN